MPGGFCKRLAGGGNLLCDQWVYPGPSFCHAVFAAGEGCIASALLRQAGPPRLEPPYFVAMILCFLLFWHRHDRVAGYAEYVSSFKASLLYSHNFLWPRDVLPLVNPVTWSLEIEVQFYILAPLIARIYTLGTTPRRLLLILAILAKTFIPAKYQLPHATLIDFF